MFLSLCCSYLIHRQLNYNRTEDSWESVLHMLLFNSKNSQRFVITLRNREKHVWEKIILLLVWPCSLCPLKKNSLLTLSQTAQIDESQMNRLKILLLWLKPTFFLLPLLPLLTLLWTNPLMHACLCWTSTCCSANITLPALILHFLKTLFLPFAVLSSPPFSPPPRSS